LILEWQSSERNDIIGDCLSYMLFNVAEYEDVDIFDNIKNEKKILDDVKK